MATSATRWASIDSCTTGRSSAGCPKWASSTAASASRAARRARPLSSCLTSRPSAPRELVVLCVPRVSHAGERRARVGQPSPFAADRPTVGGWTSSRPTTSTTSVAAWTSPARRSTPATSRSGRCWSVPTARAARGAQRHRGGDQTRHPELELARWAARPRRGRRTPACTVYTSGEHCPMCSAAHAWVGLGRIVYAASTAQLASGGRGWGLPPARCSRCRSTRWRRAYPSPGRHPSSPTSSGSCTGARRGQASPVPIEPATHTAVTSAHTPIPSPPTPPPPPPPPAALPPSQPPPPPP